MLHVRLSLVLCLRQSWSSVVSVPLPTHRLASAALQALSVDAELSPLVRRHLSLTSHQWASEDAIQIDSLDTRADGEETILRIDYRATTDRMLRVGVNGFMDSVGVVLQVMEELDVDVL